MVARGARVRQIAEHLNRSIKTVETHICNIGNKLGNRDRVMIARWCLRNGMAGLSEAEDWPQ